MAGPPFWARTPAEVSTDVRSPEGGLSAPEAARRLEACRRLALRPGGRVAPLRLLASKFADPMVLLLGAAALISFGIGETTDGIIVLVILLASGVLGFAQEYGAARVVDRLLRLVAVKAEVRRDGAWTTVPVAEVVPGDRVRLRAGATVPGDARVVAVKGLLVDEAALTGEPWPVEKAVEAVSADAAPTARASAVFLGTHVVSGEGEVVVVHVGAETRFGEFQRHVRAQRPPTEFETGLQRFGTLLLRVTGSLVLLVFTVHVSFHRPVLDAFLFAVALAVGLVPELLPAIVTITLAQGARRMARREVVVKRLAAIEDFGSLDVICSDKTGTLTEGRARLAAALAVDGSPSALARTAAALNARLQTAYPNPVDRAILEATADVPDAERLAELPYDFHRRRLSVRVAGDPLGLGFAETLLTKGAPAAVLPACDRVRLADGAVVPVAQAEAALAGLQDRLGAEGYRTLAVAARGLPPGSATTLDDERELVLLGVVTLEDPPKVGVSDTVSRLARLGVRLVMVTGDHHAVAQHVAREVGLSRTRVLTGAELRGLPERALVHRVQHVDVFAEVEPDQKERIVRALRQSGQVVGYLGDGINDAAALHAADVGVSVDGAVDVAKEAADIVLLRPSLDVLADGVEEGRRTFANTLKYVQITTSANVGNMASMAAASLFLPFLPLLPKQILLNNFLSDVPAFFIASDAVDPELVARPRRWDVRFLRDFLLVFGGISAVFDLLCFAVLLSLPGASEARFRTGWFIESVLTELFVLLSIRTARTAWKSRPSAGLLVSTLLTGLAALVLPWTPIGPTMGLEPLPLAWVVMLVGITAVYVLANELGKVVFHRWRGLGVTRASPHAGGHAKEP